MENVRGSFFMVFAMAAFAVEDMFVKSAAKTIPVGEILILFGLGGTMIFILLTLLNGDGILHRKIASSAIVIRAICEIAGRLFYTLAIALTSLSSASAILQATPLIVVMGAAIFFWGESWLAALVSHWHWFCQSINDTSTGPGRV